MLNTTNEWRKGKTPRQSFYNVVNHDIKQRSGTRVGGSRVGPEYPYKVTPQPPPIHTQHTPPTPHTLAGIGKNKDTNPTK